MEKENQNQIEIQKDNAECSDENNSDMAEGEELKKHDIEQPILHGLIHAITFSGFFHSISINLMTTLMSYAETQYHVLLFTLGGIFGAVLSYGLCQNMNKRKIVQLSDFMYLLGIISCFITYSYYYICSIFLGFSMGLSIFALLLDIKEIIPHSSYLAKHMCLYQIYFCLGLMVCQIVKLDLHHVYQADSNSTFDIHSFDKGQLSFLLISMGFVVIRFILLSTIFRMSTPFEIIRFHQSQKKFQTSVHKMYNVQDETHLRQNLVHKYKKDYLKSELVSNPRFFRQVVEGFLLSFFSQASGCQIFMNTQQITINDLKNNVTTPESRWFITITGVCSLVGAAISFFIINHYTRIRWSQIGLISIMICQAISVVLAKYGVDTFVVLCIFHFVINLGFLQAIYSFCAHKFLEFGLLICQLGQWIGFGVSGIIFYYTFLESNKQPLSFVIFLVIAFVGLIFISFYAEEPNHVHYLDTNLSQIEQKDVDDSVQKIKNSHD